MSRPTLHLPRGLPAAGKTTLARRLAATGAVHVELDEFKRRLWPACPPVYDPYSGDGLRVHLAWEAAVLEALAAGRDVVADRTNLDGRAAARLRLLAPDAEFVIHDMTAVPLEACIARDAARPDPETRIGADGIRQLHQRRLPPPVDDRPTSRPAPPPPAPHRPLMAARPRQPAPPAGRGATTQEEPDDRPHHRPAACRDRCPRQRRHPWTVEAVRGLQRHPQR